TTTTTKPKMFKGERNCDGLANVTFNGIRVRFGVELVRAINVDGGGVEELALSGANSVCDVA
ncbi:unnamed protein product, partial [Rotaria socialis]